ncbi:MAG: hypothetical protein L6Q92_10605 [Phycisphaerae bacterium]|nr:hypothetical protein [Phycisphaerae bacterium]
MDLQQRLDGLIEVARELGIDVRTEPLGGESGGLCALKGRTVLFIDSSADLETRYEKTAAALAGLRELDERYLRPEIREDLDRFRSARQS